MREEPLNCSNLALNKWRELGPINIEEFVRTNEQEGYEGLEFKNKVENDLYISGLYDKYGRIQGIGRFI